MQTTKTMFTLTAIAAMFATSVFAAPLLTPRAAESAKKVIVSDVKSGDFASSGTITSTGAKGKYVGNRVVASSKADPNLLACAKIGKATCTKNPCDGKMAAACCKK